MTSRVTSEWTSLASSRLAMASWSVMIFALVQGCSKHFDQFQPCQSHCEVCCDKFYYEFVPIDQCVDRFHQYVSRGTGGAGGSNTGAGGSCSFSLDQVCFDPSKGGHNPCGISQ